MNSWAKIADIIQNVPSTLPYLQIARSESPSTVVTAMTLSTGAWSLPLVEAAEAVDEDDAGAAEAEIGLEAREEAVVEDDAGAAEAEVGLEAGAVVEVTGAGAAEAEVGLEAQAKESVVEAGVEAGLDILPTEAADEAEVFREAGAGAVNTSSLRSAHAMSTPAPEPVEEQTEDTNESDGGSSNKVFMSIFLQSGGKSSSLFESKIIILSPPIECAILRMATGSKSSRVFGIHPRASFFILLMVASGLRGSSFSTSL